MQISAILFDLDGTLLPMDIKTFTKGYFGALSKKLVPYGYDAKELINSVWVGIKAMVANDGTCSNEEVFWDEFKKIYGDKVLSDMELFNDFYKNDFNDVKSFCGSNDKIPQVIDKLKKDGYRLIIATNPIFPETAVVNRIRWAGLNPDDFELITTYENSGYCKPNPKYYEQIADKLNIEAQKCLMVGNDVTEDMVAAELGMKVFLLTDCLINKDEVDINQYPNGNFEKLVDYIDEMKK